MWIFILATLLLMFMIGLTVLHRKLLKEMKLGKRDLYLVSQNYKKQWADLENIADSLKSVDEDKKANLVQIIENQKTLKEAEYIEDLIEEGEAYHKAFALAMELSEESKRTGDLTYYTEEVKKRDETLEELRVHHNELMDTFNEKKKSFPYTLPMAIAKYEDAQYL